jgi:hypothetical protein
MSDVQLDTRPCVDAQSLGSFSFQSRLHYLGECASSLQWSDNEGLLALFSFTMLWSTSIRTIRRVAWEFFIAAHVLCTMYVSPR